MKFYRFQSINKLTLQNLTNQNNWVADPFEFNDPFEFSLYDSVLIDENGDFRNLNHIEKANVMKFKDSINEYGVVCYSSDSTNNLLWAHYADNHKGMCLVFDVPKEKEDGIYKVKYQERFPEINLTDDANSHEEIKTIVTTKSIEWKYENEYRQIFIMKNMLYEYPGILVEIIFGCRTPYEDIKMVTNIAVSKNPSIKISKMHMDKTTYSLGKVTIGNNTVIPEFWRINGLRI
ncbi:DUF2971 domain-containing protein [Flavobacterium buctense]|uniref:DUF2971 domain-containing protein n=1 Tax=Flavobacterium buctense TaxID=1648146 RepID=A0ABU9DZU8_9FLAO|nr:DUF2971 domain-containing protein [Flavobacterium buctense]